MGIRQRRGNLSKYKCYGRAPDVAAGCELLCYTYHTMISYSQHVVLTIYYILREHLSRNTYKVLTYVHDSSFCLRCSVTPYRFRKAVANSSSAADYTKFYEFQIFKTLSMMYDHYDCIQT